MPKSDSSGLFHLEWGVTLAYTVVPMDALRPASDGSAFRRLMRVASPPT